MKYDLRSKIDKERFTERANKLFENKDYVELKRILPIRSNQQNKYVHVLFAYFASEYGEQTDYIKQYFFKQICNRDIFEIEYTNPKTGEVRISWRSSADLDSGEMTIAIERFRDYASKEAGIYLPEPHEQEFLKHCEIEIERNKKYT